MNSTEKNKKANRPVLFIVICFLFIAYMIYKKYDNKPHEKDHGGARLYHAVNSGKNHPASPEEDLYEEYTPVEQKRCSIKPWEDGIIPYTIEASIPPDVSNFIRGAMNAWESVSNIKFIEKNNGIYKIKRWNQRHISSTTGSDPCGRELGMRISIQSFRNYRGIRRIVLHELGHCLGLTHEHQRSDRDRYVKINWENIIERYKKNYRIFKNPLVDERNNYYDYESIMHYHPNAFSINNKNTIDTHGHDYTPIALSDGDIQKIQSIYGKKDVDDTRGACIDDYNCFDNMRRFNCFGSDASFHEGRRCDDLYNNEHGDEDQESIEAREGTAPSILEIYTDKEGEGDIEVEKGKILKIYFRVYDPDKDIKYLHMRIISPEGRIHRGIIKELSKPRDENPTYQSAVKMPEEKGNWYYSYTVEDEKGNFSMEKTLRVLVVDNQKQ